MLKLLGASEDIWRPFRGHNLAFRGLKINFQMASKCPLRPLGGIHKPRGQVGGGRGSLNCPCQSTTVLWNFFFLQYFLLVQHLPRICGQNEDKIVPSPTNSPAPKDHFKFWANAGRFIEMKMSRTSYWGGPSSSECS